MSSFHRKRQIYLLSEGGRHFFHSQWAGGVILLFCSILTLILANLPWTSEWYNHFWHNELSIQIGSFDLTASFEKWINDGLMAIFFFSVGLEIKREMIAGQLASIRQATLPLIGAIGGMIAPALIYAIFNAGGPTEAGWGIPMATDIAFALGVLSLLGNRVPLSLKIFLTALAIVDDLGAILVIAFFYTSDIDWNIFLMIACVMGLLIVLNRMKVFSMKYYLIPSIALWLLFLSSGIHATIAGVIIALTIPTRPRFSKSYFMHKTHSIYKHLYYYDEPGVELLANEPQHEALEDLRKIARNSISPSQRLEYALHSTVTFFIMPLFALANAGVVIDFARFGEVFTAQAIGIICGLVIGKPLGIFGLCWLGIKLKISVLPKMVTWAQFLSVACVGGIGFTMSIFINNLAFSDPALISNGKIAILMASLLAGVVSYFMVSVAGKRRGAETKMDRFVVQPAPDSEELI
ncbi:MAG: Na+/H+ antiporter NhaA [Rikenellaceae bacterium]|jgi:NhaA family Na+:H+ antiporter|nr:Na+/H+ antiporter NhaA [Rikenellaceae bacterium]